MFVNGELIRLDTKAKGTLFEPKDWVLVEGHPMMRHTPTGDIFKIDCDDEAMHDGAATLFQFSARLVHVCNYRELPSDAEQVRLGRAAIVAFLQAIGAWKPVVTDVLKRRSNRYGAPRPA